MATAEKLLTQFEGKSLEFKRDLSSPRSVLKTLVAFANTAGGSLIIGVDDDRSIIGVEDPLLLEEQLTSLIADNIEPLLIPTIKIVHYQGKSLILVEVPFLINIGPFYLKRLGSEKGVMVRLGSTTRAASKEMIQELNRIHVTSSFDAMPCIQSQYDDLDISKLELFFSQVSKPFSPSLLKSLKLLVPYGDRTVPSNAAIILFGKEAIREHIFPMAYVSCARFSGTEKVDFIDRLDIHNIMEAVEKVPAFIRRNTRMGAIIQDIKRQDIPEYPTLAVREGLLNAFMHADYSYKNMRFFISILDDRLEIRSPGCFPPGMTIEGIKEGISIPRNHVIARIFQMLGWVEQFGTGYYRISKACAKHHYPLPEWRETGPYVDVIFKPLKIETLHQPGLSRDQDGTKSGLSRDQVGTKSILSDELLQFLRVLQDKHSAGELMKLLNWKNRTKFTNRFLNPLLEDGLLARTLPDKPRSRFQKYYLTELGRNYLKAHQKTKAN